MSRTKVDHLAAFDASNRMAAEVILADPERRLGRAL